MMRSASRLGVGLVAVGLLVPLVCTTLGTSASAATPSTASSPSPEGSGPKWTLRPTGTDAQFRGLSPVDHRTAWLAGSKGTVLRTQDAGRTWENVSPEGAAGLEFRDVQAFDARRAVALSIGEGDASRIYVTGDGGRTWKESFRNDHPKAFYDCMTFLDRRHGLAVSDPVDGRFRILRTGDGGRSWNVVDPKGMPEALEGEFAFAASGTCLVSKGGRVWIATGGGAKSRVLTSEDRGSTWSVVDTPVASGPSAGIYSLAFRDRWHGVAVGGDYTKPDQADRAAAVTNDGGRTWKLVPAESAPQGYRSGSAWLGPLPFALAVGPTGSEVSWNGGRDWRSFDSGAFDSVECVRLSCWASGPKGRAAVLTFG